MLNVQAVGHRVLVKPDPVKKTSAGIILAVDHKLEQGATTTGTVLQVGPDAFYDYRPNHIPVSHWDRWVKEGDRVVYAKYAGRFIDTEEKDEHGDPIYVVVMNDQDIFAKIVED